MIHEHVPREERQVAKANCGNLGKSVQRAEFAILPQFRSPAESRNSGGESQRRKRNGKIAARWCSSLAFQIGRDPTDFVVEFGRRRIGANDPYRWSRYIVATSASASNPCSMHGESIPSRLEYLFYRYFWNSSFDHHAWKCISLKINE